MCDHVRGRERWKNSIASKCNNMDIDKEKINI